MILFVNVILIWLNKTIENNYIKLCLINLIKLLDAIFSNILFFSFIDSRTIYLNNSTRFLRFFAIIIQFIVVIFWSILIKEIINIYKYSEICFRWKIMLRIKKPFRDPQLIKFDQFNLKILLMYFSLSFKISSNLIVWVFFEILLIYLFCSSSWL